MTAVTKSSKLGQLLEKLFANPAPSWTMLPSGAEIKCKGIAGEREILVRRVGSRPGDVELRTFATHAGFEDWHVFWLANQVAWLIEVCPDGQFYPDLWLEASGKTHLVVQDQEQPTSTRALPVKSFVQAALAKPVQPDPEDAADYLKSVQAAEGIVPTPAESDAVLEPVALKPVRIAARISQSQLGARAGIALPRVTEIERGVGEPISSEERTAYLAAVESWQADRAEQYVPPVATMPAEATRDVSEAPNADQIATMVSSLLVFGQKHGWPAIEIGPGVRLVGTEDGWRKFVAANIGYQILRAHTAAHAIDPAWFALGGKR